MADSPSATLFASLRAAARVTHERFLVGISSDKERKRVTSALSSEGSVVEVTSTREAMDRLSEESFELIVLDLDERSGDQNAGDKNALSAHEQEGYRLFKSYGCASCHQGANVGGNMFQRFGVMGDYFNDRGQQTTADLGRYNVTGLSADRHVFRVPSLRLAVLTAPYFHDGSAKTLREAIDVMAKYQLGREIPEVDNHRIITFLASLPGDLPEKVEHAHP